MMGMAAVLAFMSSSCKKNNEQNGEITIMVPAFEEVMADPSEAGRAYIDFNHQNVFKWNAYDEVMVYNLDATDGTNTKKAIYRAKENAEGKQTAKFYFYQGTQLGNKMDHFFIFYPTCKIVNGIAALDKDNFETFDVPAEQNYTLAEGGATFDPESMAMACEVNKLTQAFTLKHIFGGCRIRLKGVLGTTVDKIVIEEPNPAVLNNLTGTATLKLHEVEMDEFTNLQNNYNLASLSDNSFMDAWNDYRTRLGFSANGTGNTITLNCNGVALNPTSEQNFYVSLRPGSLINGFTLKVYYNGLTEPQVIENFVNPNDNYCIRAGVCTTFAYLGHLIGE
jgi:hypothetical protein